LDSVPVVSGDRVFVATSQYLQDYGKVFSLDKATGSTEWVYDTHGTIMGGTSPAVSENLVYVPVSYLGPPPQPNGTKHDIYTTGAGALIALDKSTGSLVWSRPASRAIITSPTVEGGVVFIVLDEEGVYAFDGETGAVRWFYPVSNFGILQGAPLVYDGTVYVGTIAKGIFALDAANGALKWHYVPTQAHSGVTGGLTAGSGMVFAPLFDTSVQARYQLRLAAFKADSGELLWLRLLYDLPFSPPYQQVGGEVLPAFFNGTVFATGLIGNDDTSTLYALDATTGNIRWQSSISVGGSNIAIANHTLLVPASPGLIAFDGNTGQQVWSYQLPKVALVHGPVLAGESVYLGIWAVGLYAITNANTVPEFSFPIANIILASTLLLALASIAQKRGRHQSKLNRAIKTCPLRQVTAIG
jgi:outer membrane protein assembly factor BamB